MNVLKYYPTSNEADVLTTEYFGAVFQEGEYGCIVF